jgi:hypothetical protein
MTKKTVKSRILTFMFLRKENVETWRTRWKLVKEFIDIDTAKSQENRKARKGPRSN